MKRKGLLTVGVVLICLPILMLFLFAEPERRQQPKFSVNNFPHSGWSPVEACDFMSELGMPTGNYRLSIDESTYQCLSRYKTLGENELTNIAYYVSGSAATAVELKLVLNLHHDDAIKTSLAVLNLFAERCDFLTIQASGAKLPQNIKTSLQKGSEGKWRHRETSLRLIYEKSGSISTFQYSITK